MTIKIVKISGKVVKICGGGVIDYFLAYWEE